MSPLQLDKYDTLYSVQSWLLEQLKIACNPIPWQKLDLTAVVTAARILCLRQAEVVHLRGVDDLQRPLNPRNEAAALALLIANMSTICGSSEERQQQLHQLAAAYPGSLRIKDAAASASGQDQASSTAEQQQQAVAGRNLDDAIGVLYEDVSTPEQQLLRWVLSQGATTQLKPALFPVTSSNSSDTSLQQQQQPCPIHTPAAVEADLKSNSSSNALRGCAAAADLPAGSTVISLPAKLLITYKTTAESDFGRVLYKLGLDPETLAVVWTMVERWDEDAVARTFWKALPDEFNTGLSVSDPLVDLLKGTSIHQEMTSARQHVRQQYKQLEQVFSVLLSAYTQHLQQSWFSLQHYLWAVELWYAYAIQVKFPDGSIQPALAPFISLINHSPWPHIVHYSTINPRTETLDITTFRSVQQQQQVFLSYGPLPNAQLLLFYGFAVRGYPFEEVQIRIDLQQQQQDGLAAAAAVMQDEFEMRISLLKHLGLWQQQQQYTLTVQQPLPLELKACIRLLTCNRAELKQIQQAAQQQDEAVQQQTSTGSSSKGKGSKKSGSCSSSKMKSVDSSSSSELQDRWAAAAVWSSILGQPLSGSSEAAAQQLLTKLLQDAKQPYEAVLHKIAKRKELQKMLLARQQQQEGAASSPPVGGLSSSGGEDGWLQGVETYLVGVIALYDACGSAFGL